MLRDMSAAWWLLGSVRVLYYSGDLSGDCCGTLERAVESVYTGPVLASIVPGTSAFGGRCSTNGTRPHSSLTSHVCSTYLCLVL
ncbi:hypothetical protein BC834DRAFT_871647 [Gloeopeniophorella convolvens]|nr:hypothetical protein BC834DRAFT_910873 [Gloeopeniophorella convolvens]KAI0267511.1 hypothetical protein BC834DRAFT_871647 [Gloeopeniophorella convolvens]